MRIKGVLLLASTMALLVAGGQNEKSGGEGKPLVIKVAALGNPDSPEGLGYQFFKEDLEKRSQGKIKVNLFLSGQLGDFKTIVNELRSGDFEMTQSGPPAWIVPESEILGAPYLVRSKKHFENVMKDSDFGKSIINQLENKGLKVLTVFTAGSRVVSANRQINSIADMAGLRIRVPPDEYILAFARNVGANPTPIAFQEVYLALQTNQVDAEENPLATIKAMKFYEVQKSIAITNHYTGQGFLYYSLALWNKLAPQQQQWILASSKAFGDKTDALFQQDTDGLEQFFIDQGLTITRPDLEPFRDAMKPYYAGLTKKFNTNAIEEIKAIPG